MITTDIQRNGTVRVSITGTLDEDAGPALQRALDDVTADERDLMVDLHGAVSMDTAGLLRLLALHRRAGRLRLRVLVIGWQPQPQQVMADVAGIRGPGSATAERYALAGSRRLIEERAQRRQDSSAFRDGRLSRALVRVIGGHGSRPAPQQPDALCQDSWRSGAVQLAVKCRSR